MTRLGWDRPIGVGHEQRVVQGAEELELTLRVEQRVVAGGGRVRVERDGRGALGAGTAAAATVPAATRGQGRGSGGTGDDGRACADIVGRDMRALLLVLEGDIGRDCAGRPAVRSLMNRFMRIRLRSRATRWGLHDAARVVTGLTREGVFDGDAVCTGTIADGPHQCCGYVVLDIDISVLQSTMRSRSQGRQAQCRSMENKCGGRLTVNGT